MQQCIIVPVLMLHFVPMSLPLTLTLVLVVISHGHVGLVLQANGDSSKHDVI